MQTGKPAGNVIPFGARGRAGRWHGEAVRPAVPFGEFRPYTAAELLAKTPAKRRWVWDRYLPEGALALLTAYMRVGKTSFVYPLALAVARGEPFLDFATRKTGVLILAVEEHPHDVELRLGRLGLTRKDNVHVHEGKLENTPRVRNQLRRYIRHHGIGLVIVDTLSRFWSVASENDNAQVRDAISPLVDLAHRPGGPTVLLVHHQRKAGGQEGRGIRGAGALLGLTDQALELDRLPGKPTNQRILRAWPRYSETPTELLIEMEGTGYRNLGKPKTESVRSHAEAVLAALSKKKSRTVAAIADRLRISEQAVRKALQTLKDRVRRSCGGVKGKPYRYKLRRARGAK
jgi:predicted ATP-dependent serine protease